MTKSILITGCSSGIGLFTAQTLKQKGYHVIATCRKSQDLLVLKAQGFDTLLLDLNDAQSVEQAAQQALEMTDNRLYALFNNAGYGVYGKLATLSRQALEQQFSTNVFGVHQLTKLILPAMLAQKEGRVIMTSSVVGIVATPGRGAYAASKQALEALTDTLRLEYFGSGVMFSLLEPGPVSTPFKQNVKQTEQHQPVKNPKIAERFTLSEQDIMPYVIHALESRSPKIRYRISALTKGTAIMKRLFSDRIVDRILRSK